MGFITLKCPSCGAPLELDDSREFGFCQYCGTKIVQDKIVVEHRGTVSVDGIATLTNLMERATNYLKDGNYEESRNYFNRALDANPKCSQAYWGLLLCRLRVRSNKELVSKAIETRTVLSKSSEFKNAYYYATEKEKKRYAELDLEVNNGIAEINNKLSNLSSELNALKSNIDSLGKRALLLRILSVALMIIGSCLFSIPVVMVLFWIIAIVFFVFSFVLKSKKKDEFSKQFSVIKEINVLSPKPLYPNSIATPTTILTVPVKGGFEKGTFTLRTDCLVYKSNSKTVAYKLKDLNYVENKMYYFLIHQNNNKSVRYAMGGKMKDLKLLVNETNKYIQKIL